jgi:hypothetical protein
MTADPAPRWHLAAIVAAVLLVYANTFGNAFPISRIQILLAPVAIRAAPCFDRLRCRRRCFSVAMS